MPITLITKPEDRRLIPAHNRIDFVLDGTNSNYAGYHYILEVYDYVPTTETLIGTFKIPADPTNNYYGSINLSNFISTLFSNNYKDTEASTTNKDVIYNYAFDQTFFKLVNEHKSLKFKGYYSYYTVYNATSIVNNSGSLKFTFSSTNTFVATDVIYFEITHSTGILKDNGVITSKVGNDITTNLLWANYSGLTGITSIKVYFQDKRKTTSTLQFTTPEYLVWNGFLPYNNFNYLVHYADMWNIVLQDWRYGRLLTDIIPDKLNTNNIIFINKPNLYFPTYKNSVHHIKRMSTHYVFNTISSSVNNIEVKYYNKAGQYLNTYSINNYTYESGTSTLQKYERMTYYTTIDHKIILGGSWNVTGTPVNIDDVGYYSVIASNANTISSVVYTTTSHYTFKIIDNCSTFTETGKKPQLLFKDKCGSYISFPMNILSTSFNSNKNSYFNQQADNENYNNEITDKPLNIKNENTLTLETNLLFNENEYRLFESLIESPEVWYYEDTLEDNATTDFSLNAIGVKINNTNYNRDLNKKQKYTVNITIKNKQSNI